MRVFISHNRADKVSARLLAIALVQRGMDVWFDEWEIRPGDSITGGIERGVSDADVFMLIWSSSAAKSNWVGMELRAFLRRRVDDDALRVIPVMIDDAPLPSLVADYRGFDLAEGLSPQGIATEIAGCPPDREIARLLQDRLLEITDGQLVGGDELPYVVCPECGSTRLERFEQVDYARDDRYYCIRCKECSWSDATEL